MGGKESDEGWVMHFCKRLPIDIADHVFGHEAVDLEQAITVAERVIAGRQAVQVERGGSVVGEEEPTPIMISTGEREKESEEGEGKSGRVREKQVMVGGRRQKRGHLKAAS